MMVNFTLMIDFILQEKLSPKNKLRIKATPYGGSWNDWPEDLKLACHKKIQESLIRAFMAE